MGKFQPLTPMLTPNDCPCYIILGITNRMPAKGDENEQNACCAGFNVHGNLFAGTPLYYVIDLRGGPSAKAYPVKTLDAVPSGGWTKVDKTLNLVLRRIDAGKFMSGSPTNEVGRMNAEDQRIVTIDKPFYIGVFEVTQAQYLLVTGIIPASHRGFSNPVENVSWGPAFL